MKKDQACAPVLVVGVPARNGRLGAPTEFTVRLMDRAPGPAFAPYLQIEYFLSHGTAPQ
jgi:hypothetical protein